MLNFNYEIKKELANAFKASLDIFRPPPKEKVSVWTPKNIKMSSKHDSIGGRYVPFPYQNEILDISTDLSVREIVLMTSAQVGKTWSMLIIAAHRMKHNPCGIVWAMDSKESVEFLSSSRFDPMVEESKTLSELVAKKSYKSQKNKTLYKDYLGGYIRFATAGSPGQLASAAAPLALGDEIDKWSSIKEEGDPLSLLEARLKMQINPLLVISSTPTIRGDSNIETRYNDSDKRRYYIPCPHCQHEHILIFENLIWESKQFKTEKKFNAAREKLYKKSIRFFESKITKFKLYFPDTAIMKCPKCAALMTDYEKNLAVMDGRWIAERPFMGIAGFHLNEMYSPKRTFSDIALDFLKKKDDPASKQTFWNATLGLTWELPTESMKSEELEKRIEKYYYSYDDDNENQIEPVLPKNGAILTAGVDVQLDRLEATVRLWGPGYESWGIEYLILYGDPYQDTVWNELSNLLNKEYQHPNGMKLTIQKCAIDSSYATDRVYDYVSKRRWPTIPIQGRGGAGIPVHTGKPSRANDYKVPVYSIGVDTIKNTLYQRSFIAREGPGKIHWNQNYNATYFEQFTAEKRIKKELSNGSVHVWEKPPGKSNEGLDTEVYAYAALHLIGLGNIEGTIKAILSYDPKEDQDEHDQESRDTDDEYNEYVDDL